MPPKRGDESARFWSKVDLGGTEDCWPWRGYVAKHGYGHFGVFSEDGWKPARAHRMAFELAGGALVRGLHVHHTCGNKICVNPRHLQLVSPKDHGALHHRSHCRKGHQFTSENTEWFRNGRGEVGRTCRECHRDRQRAYVRQQAEKVPT